MHFLSRFVLTLAIAAGAAPAASGLESRLASGVDANDPLLKLGLLDVTRSPYRADPTGVKDATKAIQQAVNDARDCQYVCFFPEGTYVISDTISAMVGVHHLGSTRRRGGRGTVTYEIQRDHPCILIGSQKGKRPVIRLSREARGFDDPARPKPAIHIWAQTRNNEKGKSEPAWGKEQANISFNQMLKGIDIDVRGHAGAVGVQHAGSQGSTLEDVTVLAEGAFAGLENCPGQGGGTYNVTVLGGRYGLHASAQCRFPMLAGCVFQGQSCAAVSYAGQNIPIVLVGCRLEPAAGRVFETDAGLNAIDCMVSGAGGELAAAERSGGIYLENVFVIHAERVWSGGGVLPDPNQWTCIRRYSHSPAKAAQYVNGQQTAGELVEIQPGVAAPSWASLHDKHVWTEWPSLEDTDAVNAKTLGAVGDGVADDTEALQRAIDAHDKVFLPRGAYRVTKPLVLRPTTSLFGVARIYSTIQATDGFGEQGQPLVTTVDDADAATRLSFLSLAQYATDPNVNLLAWRAGRHSQVRNVYFELKPGEGPARKAKDHTTTTITGHGGGRWYAVNAIEGKFAPTTVAPCYRRLLVEGTSEPLAYYALNVERVVANPQAEIRNASNVRIYYFKAEAGSTGPNSRNTPLRVVNSHNIGVYAFSGNITLKDLRPIVDLVDSTSVTLTNLKSFHSGSFLTLSHTQDGRTLTVPSNTAVSLFMSGNKDATGDNWP